MTSFGGGSIAGCRVRCYYKNQEDLPLSGNVTLTPAPALIVADEVNTIYYPTPQTAVLDGNGLIDLTVFASDDPDLSPNNWTYTVTETLTDAATVTTYSNTYSIKAPSNGDIWLSDVVPVVNNVGQAIVRGPRGNTADFAALAIALGG